MKPYKTFAAKIVGTVVAPLKTHHNFHGNKGVYELGIEVARDSGTKDYIVVLLQKDKIKTETFTGKIEADTRVCVRGAIQTYKDNRTGHVQLFVWAYEVMATDEEQDVNKVIMTGEIARGQIFRTTPKGRTITEFTLRVPSCFTAGFYSFVPCIAWENIAEKTAGLEVETRVYAEGRIQSREYIKRLDDKEEKRTAWEVSLYKLEEEELSCSECLCLRCANDCMQADCMGYPSDAPQDSKQEEIRKCYARTCKDFIYNGYEEDE